MTLPAPQQFYQQSFSGPSTPNSHYGLLSPPLNETSATSFNNQQQYQQQQHQQPQQYIEPNWMPDQYSTSAKQEDQSYYPRQEHTQLATPLPSPDYVQPHQPHLETDYYQQQPHQYQQVQAPIQWEEVKPLVVVPPPRASYNPDEESYEDSQEWGSRKPFISKLGYLLRNPDSFADCIQWNVAGDTFILAPSARLTQEVLPEIFSHSSVSAFTRQLNTYAFRHLTAVQLAEQFSYSPDNTTPIKELSAWTHPLFLRDQPNLANRMLPTPSRARQAHSVAKNAMLMESGTSKKKSSLTTSAAEKKRKAKAALKAQVSVEVVTE